MKNTQHIIDKMPYGESFCFLDDIISIDEKCIKGSYAFKASESFYTSHFPGKPITPGAILLECMGQIGCVAFGIYLLKLEKNSFTPIFSHAEVEFLNPVYPETNVEVFANKKYLRQNHLRNEIIMKNAQNGKIIARANMLCTFLKINQYE
jgi:3-hydroxyacyl-[acyl-carrier-protein] dehydratase